MGAQAIESKTTQISIMNFKVGMVVLFSGARFQITAVQRHQTKSGLGDDEMVEVVCGNGKWLSGRIERGYFGPTQDWIFQGNARRQPYPVEIDSIQ